MGGEEDMYVQLSKIGFLFTGITQLLGTSPRTSTYEAQRWPHHRRRATQCGRVRAVGLAAPPDDRRGASGAR